jgi:hypothetical protein
MLSQAWHPLNVLKKRLSNTQMNGSREDTEQQLKRRQVKRHGVRTDAGEGSPWRRTSIPRTTDDWPIFRDNTDWVTRTRISVATLIANGFESGSAAIPHWLMAVQGGTSTMYINAISGQPSYRIFDRETDFDWVAAQTDCIVLRPKGAGTWKPV